MSPNPRGTHLTRVRQWNIVTILPWLEESPDSELDTRFPNVSPLETWADARALWPERVDDSSAAHRRSRSVGDFSNLGWYEAIYGSGRPISPTQHRFPSTPQALEDFAFLFSGSFCLFELGHSLDAASCSHCELNGLDDLNDLNDLNDLDDLL